MMFVKIYIYSYEFSSIIIYNLTWIDDWEYALVIFYYLIIVIMSKRWLRYGLVGNFLSYGLGTLFIAYTGKKIII